MRTATQPTSKMPICGAFAGLLLLAFAGTLAVLPSSERSVPRRLQQFGYITTTPFPSSFDSSDSSSFGSSFEPSKSLESGSLESSEYYNITNQITGSLGSIMGWLTFSLLVQACWAMLYYNKVVQPIEDEFGKLDDASENRMQTGEGGVFPFGFFQCYKAPWVCLQGLFCPMVRIAQTNSVSGVCPFWESLFCWCCCAWTTFNVGPFCLLLFWRLRLKNIMGVQDDFISDFCLTIICPQVSICQMSTAVDSALGYQTTGCCEYTPYSRGGFGDSYGGEY